MPLEFMDEDGTQISALVCGEVVEPLSQSLRENKVYLVSNGTVKVAAKKYTSIKNDYSILLDSKSHIEECEDDKKIGDKGFNFTLIKTIENLPEGAVIDVLGQIQNVGARSTAQPKKEKGQALGTLPTEKMYKRVITLIDESKVAIEATLWRDLSEKELVPGLIIALKRMRVTAYNGKQLSSTRDTELVIDPPDTRVKEIHQM
jgi:replication factor A1